MTKIFISYRHDDSAYAAFNVYEKLSAHFGPENVFLDIDTIPLGVDFREHIKEAVGRCQVLLAIIGDHWLNDCLQSTTINRDCKINDPRDYVRIEIETGLNRKIHVIPVLCSRASMPDEDDLPDGLKLFAYRNAFELRPGRNISEQVESLVQNLSQIIAVKETYPDTTPYKKIFLSYSIKDQHIARLFEQNLSTTGDRILTDVNTIRAGEVWGKRILEIISEADIFMLLWSYNAAASDFVRREWEYALSLNRPRFIRPLYWEQPPPPPPPQLVHLHFLYMPLLLPQSQTQMNLTE